MATNKELLEKLLTRQKEDADKQLRVALETSDRLNKLEMFIYGDPLTKTNGLIVEFREVKERVESLEKLLLFAKGKWKGATLVVLFLAGLIYKSLSFFKII